MRRTTEFVRLAPRLWPLAWGAIAVWLIGCGGGGGGGGGSLTTGLMTTGTPGTTTGTASGTTTSGTTTGSTTTSTGTTGGTTTGATTSGTTTGTTGSTTTGGGIPPGVLPSDTIFFSDGAFDAPTLKSVRPDGSQLTEIGTLPAGFGIAILDPNVANRVIFSYASDGSTYGIYRNSSLSFSGATEIVPPSYDDVTMMQATPDGASLVFVGTSVGVASIYRVPMAGGGPVRIAAGETAALSPDGTKVVFSAPVGAASNLFEAPVTGGAATTLTSGDFLDLYPQYSKDGGRVVFSSNRDADPTSMDPYDVYMVERSNGAISRLTTDSSKSELGASFNGAGTSISYVVISFEPGASGLFVTPIGGAATRIYASDGIGQTTYWTGDGGRSGRVFRALTQRFLRHR